MAAPILLCDCEGMPRDRWLECRDHGPKGDIEYTVGGSERFYPLWRQSVGNSSGAVDAEKGAHEARDPKNQNQLDMGHMMEPIAAHFYGIVTGNKVVPGYQHVSARGLPLRTGRLRLSVRG